MQKHRDLMKLFRKRSLSKCTWLHNLAVELSKITDIELHIASYMPITPPKTYLYTDNIHFHLIKHGVPCTQKGYPNWMPLNRLFWYFPLVNKIKKLANLISPDIIHAHGTETAYALAACKAGFPYIISIQGIIREIQKADPTISHYLQSKIEEYTIRNSWNFGCRTDWDQNIVLSMNPNARTYYLPEAINPIFFKQEKKNKEEKRILFVGTVSFAKGMDILVEAARIVRNNFPEVKFDIVGLGNEKYLSKIKKRINDLGLSSVINFHGFKNAEEIKEFHNKSQIFILPSRMENSPNAICEAMASGLPCIASRVGGIPSIIKDGHSGLLFETENFRELAEKIVKLLCNTSLSDELGKKARQIAFERNFPEEVEKQTVKVYRKIIKEIK